MTGSTDGPYSVDSCHQPLVSVLVPSYQAGPYLALLVDSVLAQTYQRWELLILDDGSGIWINLMCRVAWLIPVFVHFVGFPIEV